MAVIDIDDALPVLTATIYKQPLHVGLIRTQHHVTALRLLHFVYQAASFQRQHQHLLVVFVVQNYGLAVGDIDELLTREGEHCSWACSSISPMGDYRIIQAQHSVVAGTVKSYEGVGVDEIPFLDGTLQQAFSDGAEFLLDVKARHELLIWTREKFQSGKFTVKLSTAY